MSIAKNWCLTINNPQEGELKAEWFQPEQQLFKYAIFGNEIGKEGTPHIQAYVSFMKRHSLIGLKKLFPRAHAEVMRGTPRQASDYCKKDGSYMEIGELPETPQQKGGEATKRKYEEAWDLAKQGNFDEIDRDVLIKYYGNAKRIRSDYASRTAGINKEVTAIWYYGPTGCGKTRRAHDENPGLYSKTMSKWWDGYNNEEVILIDDLQKTKNCNQLLQWADIWEFRAEKKGSVEVIRPGKVIVTSQHRPEDIFKDKNLEKCLRLFDVIKME